MTNNQKFAIGVCIWAFAVSVFCFFLWRAYEMTRDQHAVEVARVKAMAARDRAVYALIESAGHGFAVLDENGVITEWNPGMEAMTGFEGELMLGRHVEEIMAHEEGAKHRAAYEQAFRNGGDEDHTVKVVDCSIYPLHGQQPIPVRIRVYVVRSLNKPYAVAFIDRRDSIKQVTAE